MSEPQNAAQVARLLGPDDEPQNAGAVVAVNYGDYRTQQIYVRSGANIGNWYCLGGEFGSPEAWEDSRTYTQKMFDRGPAPVMPEGRIPLHPTWRDVLLRGPVVLLVPGDDAVYREGWRNGRKHMWDGLEDAVYDEPEQR